MSLDSYRKIIESQQELKRIYSDEPSSIPSRQRVEYHKNSASKTKRYGSGRLILALSVIALLFMAALKNPSKTEAKAEIKTLLMEKVTEKMRQEVTNADNDAMKQIGFGLTMLIAPTMIDNMVQTEISDYIFFSTFDASVTVGEETKTLIEGVIVFGKAIPLKSDIN